MTIGAYGYDMANGPNPDFLALKDCQASVAKALDLPQNDVKLSMGMSTDYEHAVSFTKHSCENIKIHHEPARILAERNSGIHFEIVHRNKKRLPKI